MLWPQVLRQNNDPHTFVVLAHSHEHFAGAGLRQVITLNTCLSEERHFANIRIREQLINRDVGVISQRRFQFKLARATPPAITIVVAITTSVQITVWR